MPKRPTFKPHYGKRPMGSGTSDYAAKGSATGLPTVGSSPQGNYEQKTRYPKKGGKGSRPNSKA